MLLPSNDVAWQWETHKLNTVASMIFPATIEYQRGTGRWFSHTSQTSEWLWPPLEIVKYSRPVLVQLVSLE
jgi:hypothetical protein